MLEKETIAIEFWRKRYMRQAVWVIVLLGGLAMAAVCYFEFLFTKLLCMAIAILLIYLMVRELREDLQTRVETICTAPQVGLYGDLRFDVGRGIDEKVFENLQSVTDYQARECRNVMYQEGISLEEDIFYNVISAKFGRLQHIVFEGAILAIELKESLPYSRGEARQIGNKTICMGEISALLKEQCVLSSLGEIMKVLQAQCAMVEVYQDKIYFFMATKEKIFVQFSLFKYNRTDKFVRRILALKAQTENLYKTLNG